MPAPDLDAELHVAVAAFRAADDAISADNLTDEDADPALGQRWSDLADAIAAMDADTLPGLAAKAQATIMAFERDVPVQIHDDVAAVAQRHEWLAYCLALDVLRVAGADPWPEHSAKQSVRDRAAAQDAEHAANPPPPPAWRVEADAESARLGELGLARQGGFTIADEQLVGWLLRRVEADQGPAAAVRLLELTTMPAERFGPGWQPRWSPAVAAAVAQGRLS